jgi:hypothetical protein
VRGCGPATFQPSRPDRYATPWTDHLTTALTFHAQPSYLRAGLPDKRPDNDDRMATMSLVRLDSCVVLGGTGYRLNAGREVAVEFSVASIAIYTDSVALAGVSGAHVRITYPEIIGLQIDGPGVVSRGGGFIGGGFGVMGALEGIGIASVLNALTTKTNIYTFLQIATDSGEIFLHYGGLEPGALRIALSPIFLQLRRLDHTHIASRVARFEALRRRDVIDDEELARLTAQLTRVDSPSPVEPALPSTDEWLQCQSCRRVIRLTEADKNTCYVCKQPARLG